MSIAEQIVELEAKAAKVQAELDALRAVVSELPHAPPGFADGFVDRVKWTARWVKDHWADEQVASEWKQRFLQAENGKTIQRVAKLLKRIDVLPHSVSTHVGTGEPSFLFAVECDDYAELQELVRGL